jgi:hypothetical protein
MEKLILDNFNFKKSFEILASLNNNTLSGQMQTNIPINLLDKSQIFPLFESKEQSSKNQIEPLKNNFIVVS